MTDMENRDWYALNCLICGIVVFFGSYVRLIVLLKYRKDKQSPVFLWGELRSENAKFTFMGWIVSEMVKTISIAASLICIYYYVVPFSWRLTNAAVITYMVGVLLWYDITRWSYCQKCPDFAAIPILLTLLGNVILLLTIVHPDSVSRGESVMSMNNGTVSYTNSINDNDNVVYRMIIAMLAIGIQHHLVMDLFIWYFSFCFMKRIEGNEYCESGTEFMMQANNKGELNKISMRKLIGSQKRINPPGNAC